VGVLGGLASPLAPEAEARNLPCIAVGPADALTGALGIGSPVGDACDTVTDPVLGVAGKALEPLKDAAGALGRGVFNQVTAWVADGAVWLVGKVARLIEKSTSPDLLSKGFLRQYRLMVSLAIPMAALMLVFVVFEALGRGDSGVLWRAFFISAPLAGIATSVAYVVIQLLIATTDGMSEVVAQSVGSDSHRFFQGMVKGLASAGADLGKASGSSGGAASGAGGAAAGGLAVPLFVGFIAAVVAAFAAFAVWIELLMRDAAIYVAAAFMPFSIAAAIWPRWQSALRRTCEFVIVVVFSKFVIVAIIALAASLLAHGEGAVEQLLAAGAMLLVACFAPFVMFRWVAFAEGAVSAAFSRRGGGGGALQHYYYASSSAQMVQRAAAASWGKGKGGERGRGQGGQQGKDREIATVRGAGGGGGAGRGAAGAGAAGGAAAGAAGAAVVGGVSAAKAAKGGGEALAGAGSVGAVDQGRAGEGGGGSAPSGRPGGKAGQHAAGGGGRGGQSPSKPDGDKGDQSSGASRDVSSPSPPRPAGPKRASGGDER